MTNPTLIWTLAAIFAIAEIVIISSTWRAWQRARQRGETHIHNAILETIWLLLPALAVTALFAWSLTTTQH